ncbi:VanW family protein [Paludifilum halophilum]|uniref:Peptidoglycan binding domain-containing protein n=1 Tax=Paludifilum halophilum TaxID=1642702 RepID=A0A235B3W5_9BACL|nr:VanW family protein [Paludifilum halophilum]OYD07000.1 hypothetical protein CHM34_13790 [Paludifilum halophilum]
MEENKRHQSLESEGEKGSPATEEPGLEPVEEVDDRSETESAGSGKLRQAGESIIRFFRRLPLVHRIPLRRVGPRNTAIGAAVLTLLLFGAVLVMAMNTIPAATNADSETIREQSEATEKKKPPKPKPLKLILTHEGETWETDLRKMGFDGKENEDFDREKLKDWLKEVKKEVDQPAENAELERFGQSIRPEREGTLMDLEEIEDHWMNDLSDRVNQPQEIPMVPDEPEVTTADLERVDGKRIGRYTTYLNPGNTDRTTNVRLASEAINNRVLNPGEVFSFNKTVGKRTAARGYKPATIIVRGEYSEGLGGGICQTSSTLYNSVDAAGLAVIARFSHSKEVTYVPKGRDATVAWNGPDFRFRNNLSAPILIRSFLKGGTLTVEIYTTPEAWHNPRKVEGAPTEVESTTDSEPNQASEELNREDE